MKNIAIVYGGNSSEYGVSVLSGKNTYQSIDTNLFNPWLVELKGTEWKVMKDGLKIADVNKNDFSFTANEKKVIFDYAYIIIHGTPGENGILQGYFELLNIPYSSCDVHASSLTFNKYFCSNYLRNFKISIARSIRIKKGEDVYPGFVIKELGLPVFVKPDAGGSSFGISKVKKEEELIPAIEKAFKESDQVLIEEFIEGREFTCGLVKLKKQEIIFPITEVIPKKEFFDYEAKYTKGMTDEITPARLSKDLTECCGLLSSKIYDLCNCSGIVRIDYILKGNSFYFLEVNTTPDMTETSFVPQQIDAMGKSLKEMLTIIIMDKLS